MSTSKATGTLCGLVVGVSVAGLYVSGANVHRTAIVVASILLGGLIGAAVGAFIGTDDR